VTLRLRPALAALLAVAAAALALPATASAVPKSGFGVQISVDPLNNPTEAVRQFEELRKLGLKRVRFELSWAAIEPQRGVLDQAAIGRADALVAEARRRGLKILLLFQGSPCWASSAPAGSSPDACYRHGPRDPQDAVRAATMLVQRYQTDLAGFQIWNEPDHRNELYWRGADKVARYVALTKTLFPALKGAAPRVPVVAGSFVGYDGRWLQALYRAGFKGSYDVLAVHFYDLTLFGLRDLRRIMRANGDRARVWLGETGWSSCRARGREQQGHRCVTRAQQARATADLYRALRRTSWVQAAYLFTARDSQEFDFGLFDRAGRTKPVARTLRAELRRKKVARTRKVTAHVKRRGGRLVVTGRAPAGDLIEITATKPRARYKGFARLDAHGRYTKSLPGVLGTSGIKVTVRHVWTKRTATRRT
jgi:polysaccharide biosynthesis protein PslG